jgi:hypothetical protein
MARTRRLPLRRGFLAACSAAFVDMMILRKSGADYVRACCSRAASDQLFGAHTASQVGAAKPKADGTRAEAA